ncbi:MAG TPA: hypothetical protein VIS06_05995 [Mycobacteriales bacterium]
MPDLPVPEAAVDAVLAAYPPAEFPDIAANAHGVLDAAAPHIGAAHLRHAAKVIRDRYPADIWADPTGPDDTPSRTGAHMCRRVAEQLDHMADELETDR